MFAASAIGLGVDFAIDTIDRLEPGIPEQASVAKGSQRRWVDSHIEVELREF